MIGAIIGDIVGSRFEFDDNNIKTKEFEFFHPDCEWTDDSLMTTAVAAALMKWKDVGGDLRKTATEAMRAFAEAIPCGGYGGRFADWLFCDDPKPYRSWGNGSAMRVSPCGWIGNSLDEVKSLALQVTDITHNHPEGIKGAESTAVSVFLARKGWKIPEIRAHIVEHYYPMDFMLEEIRPTYSMDESCQGSVPQALEAFFESTSFEDAVRNAVSIGGDSDTIAAIASSVAEAYWGVPKELAAKAETYLEPEMVEVLRKFQLRHYGNIIEMEKADRTQTQGEALGVLAVMNGMLRKMPIQEAVKKERFGRLQDRLNSLGWLGLCDERTFVVKSGGCWTRLKLVDSESGEARAIP